MRSGLAAVLLGAMLFALGCGGGGGGSAPPQPVAVNGSCSATLNQCSAGTFVDAGDTDTEHRWSCRGSGGGSTAACAIPKPIDGGCGEELNQCLAGDLDDIDDSDAEYLWNCAGRHGGQPAACSIPKPIDGGCGEEPNQCLAGDLDDVDDSDAEYLWNCAGRHGGQPAACSIPKPIDGGCGEEPNQCLAGDLDDVDDSDVDFLWNCAGRHGGQPAACAVPKPIDGGCGEEANQCLAGDLDDVDDSDVDFLWNCAGRHGGQPAMCSAPKPVDGECGEELNQCLAGDPDDIDDSDTEHLWNCAGLHGGQPAMCSLQKTVVCPNGAPAADDPLSCERGFSAIGGIDRIPLDQVKMTNRDMQEAFVIFDKSLGHMNNVGGVACDSYVTQPDQCWDPANRTRITRHTDDYRESNAGSAPFTELLDLERASKLWLEQESERMGAVKIVNHSFHGASAPQTSGFPHLSIWAAGNDGHNGSWVEEYWESDTQEEMAGEIAAGRLLFVSGFSRDVNDNYIRHPSASSCRGVDNGCLWASLVIDTSDGGFAFGTSFAVPNVAAALASILSVFPDTEYQDLARLARACAKKTGEGIDGPNGLLATSGGVGVADFSCMDEIVPAAAALAAGETAALAIDGWEIAVSRRSIAVVGEPPVDDSPVQRSADRGTLVALYHATDGANWLRSGDWLTDEAVVRWHGVSVNGQNRVYLLSLVENQLGGELPAELAELDALERLSLSGNRLGGGIPAELGSLGSLRVLSLSGNRLSGGIPAELGDLRALRGLWLSDNELSGEIPAQLGNVRTLRDLNLARNRLTGEIPAELADLGSLEELYLSGNEFTGCVPAGLADVPKNDIDELGLPDC